MSLVGHHAQLDAFAAAWREKRLHHAWLLAGPSGIGKRRFADAVAARLLADAAGPAVAEDWPSLSASHPTAHLIEAGSHLDLKLIERERREKTGDLAAGISVDQIRALQPMLHSTPALSPWRAIIVDSIDDLARPAANALLKNLEEPPANTVFLLISHAPAQLLPTIRSRCHMLRFQSLSDKEVDAVLAEQLPAAGSAERAALLTVADGSPGRALRFAGLDLSGLKSSMQALTGRGDRALGARAALAKSLAGKAAQARYEAFLELLPAHLAEAARRQRGPVLARTLALWDKARSLAGSAVRLSLDPQSVVFELTGLLAALETQEQPVDA